MSSLDHTPVPGTILKVSGERQLDDLVAKELGGAGNVTVVPSGMDTLLGIYATMYITTPTDDEAVNVWGYLDTEDGFNLKPFEFLYPNSGCGGAVTSASSSIPAIFYPVNCPVVPGGRISAWAQSFEAMTAEPYCSVTYMFGKNIILPKILDDHPGRHRWRKVGHTARVTVAAGFAPEAQYQFTLSALGGVITEVGGLYWTTTQTVAACAGGATMQVDSSDVPHMPLEFNMNAFGAALGVATSHDGSDGVTRRACSVPGEKVVHIDSSLVTDGGTAITTGYFVSMVEFVRRGE